ncbi:hypothetical protein IFM89_005455 [Coptis chinensis]|uniref:Ultraviolet-B receptor UVR8 n=1 Tax=Coptis chinensis TaxID=261450 RepID=A0A835I844_9MAGN|nr:hypothetical protein IFM89_005455 [Coptis chinensis]
MGISLHSYCCHYLPVQLDTQNIYLLPFWLQMMDLYGAGVIIFLGFNQENSLVPRFLEGFLELGSPDSLRDESSIDSKKPLKVCSVKAGGMMSLAIDSLGALWIWGNYPPQNHSGDGEFSHISSSAPLPVWEFHGHTVVKVACGNEHVVALVSAEETFTGGDLICYSWGNNNHRQLGLGDRENRLRPEIVKTFNRECPWEVYEVACGAFHTAVLTRKKIHGNMIDSSHLESLELGEKESICWTFGLGDNGQLGHGTTNSTYLPEPVKDLPPDVFLISVDCGLFHTCVVSSAGDVWSWGMEKGLGLCPDASFTGTDAGDALSPLWIPFNEYGSKFVDPLQVVCGAAHTIIVAHSGYGLWAWGRGRSGALGSGNTADSYAPCSVMWPLLDEDALEIADEKARIQDEEPGRLAEIDKKLSLAMEEIQHLRSKLTLTERYVSILHGSIFGKPFEEQDLPPSLQNSGMFDIAKEWENTLDSADLAQLTRMESFYHNMLSSVKNKLLKRRIQELINECLHSSTKGS